MSRAGLARIADLAATERGRLVVLGLAAVLLFAVPELLDPDMAETMMLAVILGLVALGLNFVMGFAGQLALGHVFFYGSAAYAAAILATEGTTNLLVLLAAGIAAAVIGALVTGIPGLRLSSWTLGLVSFFLIAIFPDLVEFDPELTGGITGVVAIPRFELFGGPLSDTDLYRCAVVLLILWLTFQRNFIYSAYGRLFAVLRKDPIQIASLGVSSYRLKLFAYVLSAVPAGVAGTIFATLNGFVSPSSFSLTTATLVLAAIMLGGQRTLYGPLLGTWILVEAQQRLLEFEKYTLLAFGTFLVVISVFLPTGIVGSLKRWTGRLRRSYLPATTLTASEEPVRLGPEERDDLVATGVSKRFGGNQALDGVTLTARSGQITALIGPNGSGKTTLLNVIGGYVRADAGTVRLGEHQLEGKRPHAIAALGVGRTFQTPSLPEDLTVAEAISVATFRGRRARLISTTLRLPRWRRDEAATAARAHEVLDELGLAEDAGVIAQALPLGKKRLAEIARAVMMRPPLLVLDEAASGLDPEETRQLGSLLRRLADEGTAVLLVEHDMDLVLSTCDHVLVLASGKPLAEGTSEEIVADPEVARVYLGDSGPVGEEAPR